MKVLDATFVIDYLDRGTEARDYLDSRQQETFIMPAPTYLEVAIGDVHHHSTTDLAGLRSGLHWINVRPVDETTITRGARVADEIGPQGPQLTMGDAIVAGAGRELDAAVVAGDSDLTHKETRKVIDVEDFR